MAERQAHISRRSALKAIGAAAISPLLVSPAWARKLSTADSGDALRFFFVTDTHYLANIDNPSKMDEISAGTCRRLVETLNALPGETIPEHAGRGSVGKVRGVIHGGDLVDSADKTGKVHLEMQATEFAAFEKDYGLTGKDGLLKYPVYEIHGNHDAPHGGTLVIEGITRRNKKRVGLKNISDNGLHYSWDWDGVHFINLGIVVGEEGDHLQRRRYAPLGSLAFLRDDLSKSVGNSKKPVVLTHHVDIARYSVPYMNDEERFLHMEWHPQDVHSFFETIKDYNVIADLFGHTHVRDIYGWKGTSKKNPFTEGRIDLFNGDNASHFGSKKQAFFYIEIRPKGLIVREINTDDAWETHQWSKEIWGKSFA